MGMKKGQAAMEYLMTYGWALVALVAVIAAIIATGAFNPAYLISEECTLQPDLSCTGHLLYVEGTDTTLMFRINNGLGYDILITGVNVTTSDKTEYESYELTDDEEQIPQGTTTIVTVNMNDMHGIVGENERMMVSIEYISCAPEVIGNMDCEESGSKHTISGRITARVEEKQ